MKYNNQDQIEAFQILKSRIEAAKTKEALSLLEKKVERHFEVGCLLTHHLVELDNMIVDKIIKFDS